MDFLFHNLSEKEKEEIRKQVDGIISSFSKKLSEIGKKDNESEDNFTERENSERSEGGEQLKMSREIMLENAPDKNSDFIIAEKKKW
jgi:Asp-tRNA(Asn)/Glu-tRNA(Gln) amidotransferase C subunit